MSRQSRFIFLSIALLLALLVSMARPITVHADDSTPPPAPTEEPVQPPTEEPVATTEPAVAPTEEPVVESTEETVSLPEVLEQLTEDTTVVVVVDGEVEPLATQEAAEVIVTGDPIFCDNTATTIAPSAAGCTGSYADLASLITYLSANQPTVAGTIWIKQGTDNSASDITIDGSVLTTWASHTLTLQGGWDDTTTNGTFSGTSDFTKPIWIGNWKNDVTVSDIEISGVIGNNGLTVGTTGNITLSNVTANGNGANGAYLRNNYEGSTGSITVDQNSTFNDNGLTLGYRGLRAYSNGSITLSNVFANGNGSSGAFLNNTSGTGSINVSDSIFGNIENGNLDFGLEAYSKGDIALHTVTANGNGWDGAYLDNCIFDWETYECLGEGSIFIDPSTFSNNTGNGLTVLSNGNIILDHVTASGNNGEGADGANLDTPGATTVICSQFQNNGGFGVDGWNVDGTFTLNDVTFGVNGGGDYEYDGTPNITSGGCPPVPAGGGIGGIGGGGQAQIAPLYIIIEKTADQLPGAIGNGNTFVSSLQVILTDLGEQTDNILITLSFPIPEGMKDANLGVMFWDGSAWVAVSGGSVVGDFYVVTVSEPGTYVLVSQ